MVESEDGIDLMQDLMCFVSNFRVLAPTIANDHRIRKRRLARVNTARLLIFILCLWYNKLTRQLGDEVDKSCSKRHGISAPQQRVSM